MMNKRGFMIPRPLFVIGLLFLIGYVTMSFIPDQLLNNGFSQMTSNIIGYISLAGFIWIAYNGGFLR